MNERIYLVKVAESRTGKLRSYRAFSIASERIEDVTSETCKRARMAWNNKTGTLEISEPSAFQDGMTLAESLPGVTVTIL